MTPPATVCHWHGGKKRTVRLAVARKRVEAEARRLLPDTSIPVDNPLAELAVNSGYARDLRDVLQSKARELESIGYSHDRAGEQQYAVFQAYTAALRDLHVMLRDTAKLNIDERLAAVTEQQAEAISDLTVNVIIATLTDLNIPNPQAARSIAAGHLKHLGPTYHHRVFPDTAIPA